MASSCSERCCRRVATVSLAISCCVLGRCASAAGRWHDSRRQSTVMVGCADVWPLPAKSWVRYAADRSAAHVGCEHSGNADAVWKLDCEFDTWAGYIGNCTAPSPGDDSSVATFSSRYDQFKLNAASIALIWLCVAIAISLCVLIFGLAVYKRVYRRRSSGHCKSTSSLPTAGTPPTPSHQTVSSSHDVETRPVCDQLSDANCQFYHAFLHSGLYASVRIQSTSPPGRRQRVMAAAPDVANAGSGRHQTPAETVTVLPVASPGGACSWCSASPVDLTSDCVRVVSPVTDADMANCDCRSRTSSEETNGVASDRLEHLHRDNAPNAATLTSVGKTSTVGRTKPRSVLVMTQPPYHRGVQSYPSQTDCCTQCHRSSPGGAVRYNIAHADIR